MHSRRCFKTNKGFLEMLAIGATDARAVFAKLECDGDESIELERGLLDYEIWRNPRIKQLAVPDLLCLKSGTRAEACAKTKLEISMSHSFSDHDRGWEEAAQ